MSTEIKEKEILRREELAENASDGGKEHRNLKRRLRKHELSEMKWKSAEKQGASGSEPFSEEDETSGLRVSAPSSHGFPNNPPPLPGAIASISAEKLSSDNLNLFNLQLSPRESLHVDTSRSDSRANLWCGSD